MVVAHAGVALDYDVAPPAALRARAPIAAQFSARVDLVQVTATVVDGHHFVRGLPREAFRVFEDDVSRPVVYFAATDVPLELLVAVDVSSSMRKVMGQVKENAAHFLTALPAGHQVTLIAFNDEWRVLAEPPMPLESQLEAIAPLVPYGRTSLYDVMLHSFEALGQQVGRRALVVFTDGEDTASQASSEVVERRAEASDAVVYVVGHGQALKSPDLRELCERLASKSGGRAFFPRQVDQLREVFDTIVDEMSSQYLIAYEPRSKAPDGKWHRIRVEADPRHDVRARQGYRYEVRQPQ